MGDGILQEHIWEGGRILSATLLLVLELVGTVSFSISGAMTGLRKNMDLFGVAILGLTTAVGGGMVRDLILGNTPPVMFRNPVYAIVALCTAVIVFLPAIQRLLDRIHGLYDVLMLWMDSLGLGIFTVVGIQTAYTTLEQPGVFLLLFVGVITGVGGGLLRDLFAGDTPYIFVKHFYACASLVGAVVCVLLWGLLGQAAAIVLGAATVVLLRILAAKYRWSLPRVKFYMEKK